MSKKTLDELAEHFGSLALMACCDDAIWRWFGYSKRPRRGSLFEWFMPRNQLARENFLAREFVILTVRECARQIYLRKNVPSAAAGAIMARTLEILSRGPTPDLKFWKIHGFDSEEVARSYFVSGLRQYGKSSYEEATKVFILRTRATADIAKFQTRAWIHGITSLNSALVAFGLAGC